MAQPGYISKSLRAPDLKPCADGTTPQADGTCQNQTCRIENRNCRLVGGWWGWTECDKVNVCQNNVVTTQEQRFTCNDNETLLNGKCYASCKDWTYDDPTGVYCIPMTQAKSPVSAPPSGYFSKSLRTPNLTACPTGSTPQSDGTCQTAKTCRIEDRNCRWVPGGWFGWGGRYECDKVNVCQDNVVKTQDQRFACNSNETLLNGQCYASCQSSAYDDPSGMYCIPKAAPAKSPAYAPAKSPVAAPAMSPVAAPAMSPAAAPAMSPASANPVQVYSSYSFTPSATAPVYSPTASVTTPSQNKSVPPAPISTAASSVPVPYSVDYQVYGQIYPTASAPPNAAYYVDVRQADMV